MMGEGQAMIGDDVLLPFLKPAAAAALNYPRNQEENYDEQHNHKKLQARKGFWWKVNLQYCCCVGVCFAPVV